MDDSDTEVQVRVTSWPGGLLALCCGERILARALFREIEKRDNITYFHILREGGGVTPSNLYVGGHG